MKYCKYCGEKVFLDAVVCVHCGRSLIENRQNIIEDTGNAGWGVLGFFFPVIGLILCLVWNKDRPNDAKKAGIGALVSVIVSVVFVIIFYAIIAAVAIGY